VHPIYLSTERVTFTASRGNLDMSYDTRDGITYTFVIFETKPHYTTKFWKKNVPAQLNRTKKFTLHN